MESREYSQVNAEPNDNFSESSFGKRRCCFCFTWDSNRSTPAVGLNWWQRVHSVEINQDNSFWARGIKAVKKIREWSEIVAGPKWKTFIRRFNRTGRRNGSNYNYDPLSYALNFDEGSGHDGNFAKEDEDYGLGNFSVRYASVPASAKASIDLGKDGSNFV